MYTNFAALIYIIRCAKGLPFESQLLTQLFTTEHKDIFSLAGNPKNF